MDSNTGPATRVRHKEVENRGYEDNRQANGRIGIGEYLVFNVWTVEGEKTPCSRIVFYILT